MGSKTCRTCIFNIRGECHRYPPTGKIDFVEGRPTHTFPLISRSYWCGEHECAPGFDRTDYKVGGTD